VCVCVPGDRCDFAGRYILPALLEAFHEDLDEKKNKAENLR
jgi:hypothetical protein